MNPSDSLHQIQMDFSKEIQILRKQGAFYTIAALVENFLPISSFFGIPSSEYSFYLERYATNFPTAADLPQKDIIKTLQKYIIRFEQISGKLFDSKGLNAERIPVSGQDIDQSFYNEIPKQKTIQKLLQLHPPPISEDSPPSLSEKTVMREKTPSSPRDSPLLSYQDFAFLSDHDKSKIKPTKFPRYP